MNTIESSLGDFHNFGKQVKSFDENRIYKPRCIFWEWLFLSIDSPLRYCINQYFQNEKILSPFKSIPSLKFEGLNFSKEGLVEKLNLKPGRNINLENVKQIGSIIGLMTWFGIGDLHWQNMAFGWDLDNKFYFTPIDIESIFEDFHLFSQTIIIPSKSLDQNKAGLSGVKSELQNLGFENYIFDLMESIYDCIQVLDKYRHEIFLQVQNVPAFFESPIRVILRSTQEYRDILEGKPPLSEVPIFFSEEEQLNRNDIPYFFRLADKNEVYFYNSVDTYIIAEISKLLHVFKVAPFLILKNEVNSSPFNRDLLFKAGFLQVIRYLIDSNFQGEFKSKNSMIRITSSDVLLNFKGIYKVKCRL